MRKLLLLAALLVGIAIPFFAGLKQFYYLLLVLSLGLFILAIKQKITIDDFLILFIMLIPFHQLRVGGKKLFLRLTEISFIPLFLFWFMHILYNKDLRPKRIPREYLILLFFIIISCFSITKALNPSESIYRTMVLIYIIIVSFVVSEILRTKERLYSIIKILLGVAAITGVAGILETFFPRFSLHFVSAPPVVTIGSVKIYRAHFAWDNPNYFALFLSIVIPITIGLLLSKQFKEHKEQRFLKTCLLLQIIGLISTYSRNGAISTIAAYLFLLWFYKKRINVFTILVAVTIIILSVWVAREYLSEKLSPVYAFFLREPLEKIEEYPELVLVYRWEVWKANIKIFLDNPFLGVGPFMSGQYAYHYAYRYRPRDALGPRWTGKVEPHNEFISLLSERGIFGFVLFVTFLILILRRGVKTFKKYENTQLGAIMLSLTAGVFNFFIAGLGEAVLTQVTFWLIVGLLFATSKIIQSEQNYG